MEVKEEQMKSGNEIIIEDLYAVGCISLQILQNWRGILRIKIQKTSGSIASNVWSKPEIIATSAKELAEELNLYILSPMEIDIRIIES